VPAQLADDAGRQQVLTTNIVSHRVSAAYPLGDTGAALAHTHSLARSDPAPTRQWIADLFEHLPEMRHYAPPRPYCGYDPDTPERGHASSQWFL
jgi:hypothetical protein